MASRSPVALITGGASGIGLAVTKRLLGLRWDVAVLDQRPITRDSDDDVSQPSLLFVKTNAAEYQEQAAAFAQVYDKWRRIDLVFANAGILDRTDFCAPQDDSASGPPPQPDTSVIDVNLNGVIWSSYLALHYFRKSASGISKLIMTSSTAGVYATGELPLYSVAKHGVVGLTRSLAKRFEENKEPITVNAIVPGTVATGILPKSLIDTIPPQFVTPASLIVQAVENIINDSALTGKVLECSGNDIVDHPPPSFINEACEYNVGGKYKGKVSENAVLEFGSRKV